MFISVLGCANLHIVISFREIPELELANSKDKTDKDNMGICHQNQASKVEKNGSGWIPL